MLRDYQARGTRLIWSSQVVDEGMRIAAAPTGSNTEQQLLSILKPLGLGLQPLSSGGWVIIARPAVGDARAAPEATAHVTPQSLNAIVVQTSRYGVERRAAGDALHLARIRVEELPGTHEDMARSLQQLPGSAAGDYSARTNVRGSRDDETVFRFDGVTLIDPFHLKNFQALFSAIDPAVTEAVDIYTGDFPIEFGGSIGAVADITPRQPTRLIAEAGVSVLNDSILFGMPFAGDRASVLINARASNLSRMARLLDRNVGEPDFRDLTMRLTWSPRSALHLSAGVMALDDDLTLATQEPAQQAEAAYRDIYAWTRGEYRLAQNLSGETLLSTASLDANREAQVDRPSINRGSLSEIRNSSLFTLRQELRGTQGGRISWRSGIEYTNASSRAAVDRAASFSAPFFPGIQPLQEVTRNLDVRAEYTTFAVHGAVRWQWRPDLVLETGLRRDSQHFQSERERSQWNARINLWRQLPGGLTLRAAWGQYTQPQALSRLDVADGLTTLEDARRAHQTSLSLEKQWACGWSLRLGAYDKRETSSLNSFDNVFSILVLTPEIEVDRVAYAAEGAVMRGVEATLRSDPARAFNGWLSYTYSSAREKIGGREVRRSWDQPHAAQAGLEWRRGAWQFAATLNWHTGWPFTPFQASNLSWSDPSDVTLSLGQRNGMRQKNFRSLNLRVSWSHPLPRGTLEASLELRNAFNSDNECCRSYQVAQVNGRSTLVESSRDWLPVTPLLGVRWRL